jgi:23S rRNA (cytidine1920-2'-O)/16S rRNA (cytidine1409-2'-O)-methyltransferase
LRPEDLPEPCDLITVDVSFISLTKVVPALLQHLKADGLLLPLIKPQFEAGRRQVGKGGIVRDPAVRREVVERRAGEICGLGLEVRGVVDSEVAGMNGNREAFALFRKTRTAPSAGEEA